jgi:hypothetical protein
MATPMFRTHILLMVILVWIFSFGLLLPPLLELWGSLGLDTPTFSCTILRYTPPSPPGALGLPRAGHAHLLLHHTQVHTSLPSWSCGAP